MTMYLKLIGAAVADGGGADWGAEVRPPFHTPWLATSWRLMTA